jgi:hypothetical protein
MESGSNSAQGSRQEPRSGQIWVVLFVAIFFVLLVLLGRSMVEHRFFRGGRIHQNGSVGQ